MSSFLWDTAVDQHTAHSLKEQQPGLCVPPACRRTLPLEGGGGARPLVSPQRAEGLFPLKGVQTRWNLLRPAHLLGLPLGTASSAHGVTLCTCLVTPSVRPSASGLHPPNTPPSPKGNSPEGSSTQEQSHRTEIQDMGCW